MIFIRATDKYKDFTTFTDYIKLLVFSLIFLSLTVLSWFLYYNIIITATLTISSIIYIILIAVPPKKIEIVVYGDRIRIDGVNYNYGKFVFWGVNELDKKLEIVLQRESLSANFIYFYIAKESENLEKLTSILSQNIPYNAEVVHADKMQYFLRYLGLR